jgi:ubiquinone/menaquinone biosynthesis C-methylase UbiE
MPKTGSIYEFLGKMDAFDNPYIGGMKGVRRLLEKLEIQSNPKFKVLEVGAATGFVSCLIANEYGCSVTSTDISSELVERGRRRAEEMGLTNMEFKDADAMALDFPDNSFDAVYSIATTGVLPDRLKAIYEYVRVVKPDGVVGGLELFIQDDVSPELEAELNDSVGMIIGAGTRVMKLGEWKSLIGESGLSEIEVETFDEDVFENPKMDLGTALRYVKLVYYLIFDSWFRSMFLEVMEVRKKVAKTSGDIFNNVGYQIYNGKKPTST